MSITYKVWNFPTFQISKQLFYIPGASIEGGYTSGAARIITPEPAGFANLEIQPSLQFGEWEYPLSSWLMSKTNGQIFKVRLAPTPQVPSGRSLSVPWGAEDIYPDSLWSNLQNWSGDITGTYNSAALEGNNIVTIDMSAYGPLLKAGHVIGHEYNCYLIDEVSYDTDGIATIAVLPPFRRNIAVGDQVWFRPWFTGTISNGDQIRQTYDAENVGAIQLEKILLTESLI